MNVSRVGMSMPKPTQAQPSFKGWVTNGKFAFRDSSVSTIHGDADKAGNTLVKFYNGKTLVTGLSTNEFLNVINTARKDGLCQVKENDFIA